MVSLWKMQIKMRRMSSNSTNVKHSRTCLSAPVFSEFHDCGPSGWEDDEGHSQHRAVKWWKADQRWLQIREIIYSTHKKSYATGTCHSFSWVLYSLIHLFFSGDVGLVPGEFLSQMFNKSVDFVPVVFDTSWPEEKEVEKKSINGMLLLWPFKCIRSIQLRILQINYQCF